MINLLSVCVFIDRITLNDKNKQFQNHQNDNKVGSSRLFTCSSPYWRQDITATRLLTQNRVSNANATHWLTISTSNTSQLLKGQQTHEIPLTVIRHTTLYGIPRYSRLSLPPQSTLGQMSPLLTQRPTYR